MLKKQHLLLLQWYDVCGRKELPWRNLDLENAGYGVYISEIMLQQTQVVTVLDYYKRFMEKFPTLKDLSYASEDEVLLLWRGLGYYSRAKNLLKTAQITQGVLPRTFEELKALPGIGDYTAGAILCFGFKQAVGFYDTNIKRFLMRFFGLKEAKHKLLLQYANEFLNQDNAFDHNQALLDLGALICTAKNPKCNICPLNLYCKGKNNPLAFTSSKKIEYEALVLNLGIYQDNKCFAMFRDPKWNMLYSFPEVDSNDGVLLGEIKHTRTRYRIIARIYKLNKRMPNTEMIEDIKNLPMGSLSLKIFDFIQKLGNKK